MQEKSSPHEMITDFVTQKEVPNIGVEENRQAIEKLLVESKGYTRGDIEVDATIEFDMSDERFRSDVDLVVSVNGKRFMVIKCAPGSLGSRHRETLAAARLLDDYQIPLCVVTDGKDADILDSVTGDLIRQGIDGIPSRQEAARYMEDVRLDPYPENKVERERIIFRSYDDMNVNVQRKLKNPKACSQ